MRAKYFPKSLLLTCLSLLTFVAYNSLRTSGSIASAQDANKVTQGTLQVLNPGGTLKAVCPLKHTEVKAQISGFLSRVTVTQQFENPFTEKIEAVYTFPLPQNAAVDDMTMLIGDKTVRGKILKREEAQAVYAAAKAGGQRASLLEQERANIFTQSVANILPGEQIKITISYVETLKYEDGSYEFVFPMVVGPRYVPGNATGAQSTGLAPDTDKVPDASRITPPPPPAGMRAGHDISVEVSLDAGVPIDALNSKTHRVIVERPNDRRARVTLQEFATIPNKDFILRYDVAGKKINDALLTHYTGASGFFTLIVQPPERVTAEDVTPKELVFVLDTSGSMSGFPIDKAKETMKMALDNLYPHDTFNLITFAGDTHILFPEPVSATKENLAKAQAFLESRQGGGGTEMMKAIKASLDPSDAQGHVRIVCFMTDGYVGNDMEIIGEVQKHPNARVFAFGIGGSVNRYLLDNMAKHGRGEVEYVALNDDGSAAARRFHERVRNPLLTDISIDWNGMPVSDVYPKVIPDLFGAKPVILTGKYGGNGRGVIRLKGKMSGRDFVREIPVDFSATDKRDVLATLWARTRVDELMDQDLNGAQAGTMKEDLKQAITQLGLDYRLMTKFTSFVAVEEMVVTDGGQPRRIDVPVEIPEGVNREAVINEQHSSLGSAFNSRQIQSLPLVSRGTVNQTVTVTSPAPATIDTASSGLKTVDGRGMDPGATKNRAPRPKPKAQAGGGGSGGSGIGYGVGGSVGGAPSPTPGPDANFIRKVSADEQKKIDLQSKLHPSLLAVVDRLKDPKQAAGADEAKFIRDGKAEVQIWLTEKSEATLAKLKALGFEVVLDPKSAKLVIGRLTIEKLAALTEIAEVRYVAPQTMK
ncbi:MAG: VIT and VWA domain-containing protein [Pyrinomonadaceae bacterium]